MPIYKLSKSDYQKIKDDKRYSFLADNSHKEHDSFITLCLSTQAMRGFVERSGIEFQFYDALNHEKVTT